MDTLTQIYNPQLISNKIINYYFMKEFEILGIIYVNKNTLKNHIAIYNFK